MFLVFHFQSKNQYIQSKLSEPITKALLVGYSFIAPGLLSYFVDKLFLSESRYYLLFGIFMLILSILLRFKQTEVSILRIPLWIFSFIVMALQFI